MNRSDLYSAKMPLSKSKVYYTENLERVKLHSTAENPDREFYTWLDKENDNGAFSLPIVLEKKYKL